ncbi:ras association domain-containing protein 3 isoform X1 [Callorhinchus milii]|uniref:ras association domain-containing protein 3 isoform X1 n=1 Tax=Callorhinchus milii TaxID=7868 RepID=UPI001C3FDD26|nr:ras association domain-containing protein 3 isoform X1 [Callorhinchus milii]
MGIAIYKLSDKINVQVKRRRSSACKYTCHTQCQDFVQLDCQQNGRSTDPTSYSENTVQEWPRNGQDVEKSREPPKVLTKEEIKQKIHLYNTAVADRLKMTLSLSSDTYTGFIKVQMDLRRPITVRPMANQGTNVHNNNNNETAFYMPKGIVNILHISSSNTAKEVIVALLRKFLVADNPAKFALFKQFKKDEQVQASKLLDSEHPLYLCLLAGPSAEGLNFILREHETGEVLWEAFSLPELKNFLRILDKEEKEHFRVICKRYAAYRERLQEALREAGKPG